MNDKEVTFRVDPTYADEEEFAAINNLLALVGSGKEFEFNGLVTAYSSGDVTPQILIVEEDGLDFGEISVEDLLDEHNITYENSCNVELIKRHL